QSEIGGVEYVDQLLQDNADAQAEMAEISSALTGAGVPEDDADCLAELDRINEELAVDATNRIPAAPKNPLPEVSPAQTKQGKVTKAVEASPATAEPQPAT
ncbi:Charged multivesicular body protein 6, partial [Perkinsus olseni]